MNKLIYILIGILILIALIMVISRDKKPQPVAELRNDKDKFSYALGMEVGSNLKNLKIEIDSPAFLQGVEDTLKGTSGLLTPQQAQQIKQELFMKQVAERNLKDGERFLSENKNKPGVVTTPSGLQYLVITEGQGPQPKSSDMVKVHYRGTLINGTEFDSSYSRNQPLVTAVTGVIKGWIEALQLMKVGSKYKLFIPSNLAYGEHGSGQMIGPNSVLIFEVELLEIVNK